MGEKNKVYVVLAGFALLIVLTLPLVSHGQISATLKYMMSEKNLNAFRNQLDQGADPNSKDPNGETLLIHAARMNRPDFVKLLIERGADVNTKDNTGKTALDYAKEMKNEELIKLIEGK
jgi:ankyrin repeat protein